MPRIVVSENVAGSEMDSLKQQFQVVFEPELWKSPQQLRDAVRDADALIVRNQTSVDADLIAAARKLSPDKVKTLVDKYTDGPDLGILGDPGVNVLRLNIALDQEK